MSNTAIRKDANLLASAQRVFGADLVTDAWVTTWSIEGNSDPIEVQRRLDHAAYSRVQDDVDFCGEQVVLKFSNGREVLLGSSEWGAALVWTGDGCW